MLINLNSFISLSVSTLIDMHIDTSLAAIQVLMCSLTEFTSFVPLYGPFLKRENSF